uniref:NADH-ubiquinone oxidoreductase chain 4L n=1 Tax=Sundasalanx sp. Chao Phraya TaxID=689625 RepID=H1UC24_9TELE|nr:NADH dehydrogenase subunit 4L [Sundasalanx sp. Chao Phraya]BAL43695.1 NADH dehydrogenase subunit 4L [Sundasalanx sp. Chao Phraya]
MTMAFLSFCASFTLGLVGLALRRTHLLSALLCLEGMMLSLFMALSLWTLMTESANFSAVPLILLAFSACEASTGLAILVAASRTHGSDQIQALNILQC